MIDIQPNMKSVQMYIDADSYNELIAMKKNRTWADFLKEDLIERRLVTDAIQIMKSIQTQEKNTMTSKVDIRVDRCEICGLEFKITDLTELPLSKKLLCKECFELFNQSKKTSKDVVVDPNI